MITRYFNLMLYKEGIAPIVNVNQYDQGEEWVFTLYGQGGVKYTPTTGAIVALKSDGHLIANAGTVDGQGRVVITETQQMTASAGKATCELQIDGDTHGTANFYLLVEPSPADGGIPSDSDLSLFQQAVDAVAEIEGLLDGETVDEKLLPIVQSETGDWLTDHITNPSNPPIDTSLTVAGAAADAKVTGDEITDLKSAISEIYSSVAALDTYGTNGTYEGAGHNTYSGAWDADTKTASMTIPADLGSTTTAMVYFTPKFLNGHKYKIAIKWDWTGSDTVKYVFAMNRPSISSVTGIQYIVNAEVRHKGDIEVLSLDANTDGYFGLGARAKSPETYSFKIAVYDVTDIDLTGISDNVFKSYADEILISASGLLEDVRIKDEYSYNMDSNTKDEVWSALGDSLTATGSGGYYLTYVADRLGLSEYNNCGIGGTTISGAENANAMYQDVRVNSLDIDSQCVTIMGGTNDIWQEYYKDYPSTNYTGWGLVDRTNHDVSTFCGAYNVLISKILYRFCKVSGYYSDVDYTGITQVVTAIDNFRLILITPPQCYHSSSDTISADNKRKGITNAHKYVKEIAELWGLPCVDTWEMGMNDMNKALFFADASADATHINAFAHERIASLLIDKAVQISRYK